MIDFQGFVSLTQDLGGITVNNRTAFSSQGHRFSAGKISLACDEALLFVRERGALPSEQNRAENQRNVLKAILPKGLSAGSDPLRFTRFVGNAAKRIKVDNDLTDSELRSTAVSLRLGPGDIATLSLPLGKESRVGGQRVHRVDRSRMHQLSQALRKDTMADYVKKHPGR